MQDQFQHVLLQLALLVQLDGRNADAFLVDIGRLDGNGAIEVSTYYNTGNLSNGIDVDLDSIGNTYALTTGDGVIKLNPGFSQILYQTEFDSTEFRVGPADANINIEGKQESDDFENEK